VRAADETRPGQQLRTRVHRGIIKSVVEPNTSNGSD
jgi:hypothetical protein